jgi:gas vesicle protein
LLSALAVVPEQLIATLFFSDRKTAPRKKGLKYSLDGFRQHCIEGVALMRLGKYESSDKSSAGTAVTFLMIGLGAGALIALLLSPKSGKELRKDLRRKYEDAKDTIGDFADDARKGMEHAVERGSEWAEDIKDSVRERVEPIERAIRRS